MHEEGYAFKRQVGCCLKEMAVSEAQESPLWTVKFDYVAQGEDELSLRRGQIIEVLSKDKNISGDEVRTKEHENDCSKQ